MDEDKVPTEFLKNNREFFKNFCFKFEGLSAKCERGFIKIVKDLGGSVSSKSKYILVEKSYFEKEENKKRKHLYHLNFILDSVRAAKVLNIHLYRCDLRDIKSAAKSSYCESGKIISELESTNKSNSSNKSLNKKRIKVNREKANPHSSTSDSSETDETEKQKESESELLWLFQVDQNNLCKIKYCTFEPGPHERHSPARRVISDEEKKVILRYLIKNNLIHKAKGSNIWKIMNATGYLTHRSPETLRNCLRRIILPNINNYGLPADILNQFSKIQRR